MASVTQALSLNIGISTTTTSTTSKSTYDPRYIRQLLSIVYENMKNHYHRDRAICILSLDNDQEKNFERSLQKLGEYSANPGTGTLLVALTKRDGRPPFLTDRDFTEYNLECQLDSNQHAVYAVTITVPKNLHQRMMLDETVNQFESVQNALPDGDMMFIQGKIRETTNLRRRIGQCKFCSQAI